MLDFGRLRKGEKLHRRQRILREVFAACAGLQAFLAAPPRGGDDLVRAPVARHDPAGELLLPLGDRPHDLLDEVQHPIELAFKAPESKTPLLRGHGAERSTLPLVPAVVDAVAPTPVLAAGGITDGRGLAAALMLGAQGALMGTRFYAATQALAAAGAKERIAAASGRDTERTRVFDVVRQHAWPRPYTGRAIRNRFMERWGGREDDLGEALDEEIPRFRAAVREGDFETAMIWAGEGVDLISDVAPAGELVRRIGAQAEACLRHASKLLRKT